MKDVKKILKGLLWISIVILFPSLLLMIATLILGVPFLLWLVGILMIVMFIGVCWLVGDLSLIHILTKYQLITSCSVSGT